MTLTRNQASIRTGISRDVLQGYIDNGELKTFRITDSDNGVRIQESELMKFYHQLTTGKIKPLQTSKSKQL